MGIRSSLTRFVPFIAYHHILMGVCTVAIILLSVLLAGCTSSNGMNNIYLVSLKYRNASTSTPSDPSFINPSIAEKVYNLSQPRNTTIQEVRAGYMGLCLTRSDGAQFCSSNAAALASMVKDQGLQGSNDTADPLNLIWIAKNFKETIVFDGLIFIAVAVAFICFLALATFPGWHEEVDEDGSEREVKPFPSRRVSQAALGMSTLGFIFALISILWQHINSSAAGTMSESLTYGAIESHVGTAAMVLGWAAVVCLGVVALALLVMIMSISLLRQLTEE
ncbi:hypothetical protein AO1008_04837 [Aspergillus oryzae 100-8]|uniref:Ca2+ regulator and membrane fusion protein Fig1-domain-containing protein n=1 Tax=Aspergillus oryzae (strain 3.042) TaxID=1160506 RepID=I8I8Y9_ASPO3|nr:hypothetical protein Ao3042_10412 [Aspergillus oryzae 3.042]KDE78559.1 hypothetical protein AO1008_04837 [Aspergillus oryzae 100-8]|eukprot:EIT73576.1 hypothetical protein Ao3042_10412 [Aspergillus oryzae 3.042]